MALHQTQTLIQLKRGTAPDLVELDPLLEAGEIIVELDTGRFKIGNGELTWTQLEYANGDSAGVTITGVIGLSAALAGKQPVGNYAVVVEPPVSPFSEGLPGATAYDANFFYVCVAPSTWRRIPLETWS
jgi:hypothetical protein